MLSGSAGYFRMALVYAQKTRASSHGGVGLIGGMSRKNEQYVRAIALSLFMAATGVAGFLVL